MLIGKVEWPTQKFMMTSQCSVFHSWPFRDTIWSPPPPFPGGLRPALRAIELAHAYVMSEIPYISRYSLTSKCTRAHAIKVNTDEAFFHVATRGIPRIARNCNSNFSRRPLSEEENDILRACFRAPSFLSDTIPTITR